MPRSPDRLAAKPAKFPARIGLVIDRVDWHAREFAKAFAAFGAQTVPVKLPLSGFATQSMSGLSIDGFADTLPDAIVVRSIPGGTFEAVTLRLGILHALRELGLLVWNDARAIEC